MEKCQQVMCMIMSWSWFWVWHFCLKIFLPYVDSISRFHSKYNFPSSSSQLSFDYLEVGQSCLGLKRGGGDVVVGPADEVEDPS